MWRNQNLCALLMRMYTGVASMENSKTAPQKTKNGITNVI